MDPAPNQQRPQSLDGTGPEGAAYMRGKMTDRTDNAGKGSDRGADGGGRRSPDEFSADPLGEKIGAMLRESYQEVVKEGIPDDFLALLRTADETAKHKKDA